MNHPGKTLSAFFLFFLSASGNSFGNEQILGPAPSVDRDLFDLPASYESPERNWFLRIGSGLGWLYYGVGGTTGFTATLPFTSATHLNGQISWLPKSSDVGFDVEFDWRQLAYSSVSGISPSSLRMTNWSLALLAVLNPFKDTKGWLRDFAISFGYSYDSRTGTETTPNAVLPSQARHFIKIKAKKNALFLLGTHPVSSSLSFQFPIAILEQSQTTGSYSGGFKLSSDILVKIKFTEKIMFETGVSLSIDQVSYSGTGTRGTTQASERQYAVTVPFKLVLNL